jgi:hypothetical protein
MMATAATSRATVVSAWLKMLPAGCAGCTWDASGRPPALLCSASEGDDPDARPMISRRADADGTSCTTIGRECERSGCLGVADTAVRILTTEDLLLPNGRQPATAELLASNILCSGVYKPRRVMISTIPKSKGQSLDSG